MMQVFELGGDVVPQQLAHNLMRLVAEGAGEEDEGADAELRSQAVQSYLELLAKPRLPSILLKVSPWQHLCSVRRCKALLEESPSLPFSTPLLPDPPANERMQDGCVVLYEELPRSSRPCLQGALSCRAPAMMDSA